MHTTSHLAAAFSLLAVSLLPARADDAPWVDLFNGKDLSNWVNVNCAPETWKVEDGVIKCTGHPTGGLRTPRQYENFIMEVEWRHLQSGGNAGIFIWASPLAAPGVPFLRSIEVQVLDNGYGNTAAHTTHGDIFPIHGSSMVPIGKHSGDRAFPSEWRSKPAPEWNHYRIEARDGTLHLSVNGREVTSGEQCNWCKGYLGLESEGAPTEWRLVRIQELPGGHATPAQTAPEAQGHRPLYNGLDLRGWKTETPDRWKPDGWRLLQKPGDPGQPLWTEAEFGDCEIIVDCLLEKGADGKKPALLLRGKAGAETTIPLPLGKPGNFARTTLTIRGRDVTVTAADGTSSVVHLPNSVPARGPLGLLDIGGGVIFANLYARDL